MSGLMTATLQDSVTSTQQRTDSSHAAARVSVRPSEHGVRGHYRATGLSGASVSVGAAGVLANFMPPISSTLFYVVTRLSVAYEVLTAITTSTPVDFACFRYTGATGASAGTASVVATPTKMRGTMVASSIGGISTQGEVRTVGTTAGLTVATGKTNDATAFAGGCLEALHNVSATGVAVLTTAGNAAGPIDLLNVNIAAGEHPLVLTGGEGFEVQLVTAGAVTGTTKYVFNYAWFEVESY